MLHWYIFVPVLHDVAKRSREEWDLFDAQMLNDPVSA